MASAGPRSTGWLPVVFFARLRASATSAFLASKSGGSCPPANCTASTDVLVQMSSRAIVGPLGRGGSGGCVARHRAIVSANNSPGKAIGLDRGTFGPGGAVSFARPVGRTGAIALAGSAGAANGALATITEGCARSCLVFAPRAFGLNHRRNASSDSSIPSPRNPVLITAIDSPLRRSFRSSLRWGSSWSVLGFFGQRACATSSVRVGLAVGAIPEWSGGEVGVMWERYSERSRDATGGHLPVSKPPGLDVGVFPHYFAFIFSSIP